MDAPVRLGMLGSGFIASFYATGIADVAGATVAATWSRSGARAHEFAGRFGVPRVAASIDDLCAGRDVDVVVVALPNHLHLDAVRSAAAHGKGVACTKPLGRTADEAGEMLRVVRDAGVMGFYAENEVFTPDLLQLRSIVTSGAIGKVLGVRSREGHSGPHAPHFWEAGTAGGGAFLDMGCHSIEAVRFLVGKEHAIHEVFAWGATLAHGGRTTGEDNAIALLRLDDGRVATVESSWSARGGLEARTEVYGSEGCLVRDSLSTSVRGFIEHPAGYLAEKTDADTGWVFPVADEHRVFGYPEMFREVAAAWRSGRLPRESFADGYIVNCVIDAAYRSMRTGRWEPVVTDPDLVGPVPAVAGIP